MTQPLRTPSTPSGTTLTQARAKAALSAEHAEALQQAMDEIAADPGLLTLRFTSAARRIGRGPGAPGSPPVEDLVRVALVEAAGAAALAQIEALYHGGDADERRAVLHALGVIEVPSDLARRLRTDALRSNDTRLVAAAVGPGAAAALSDQEWRHGVLKCLFVGVPLESVADLGPLVGQDGELARMVAGLVLERVLAGRAVPGDAWVVLADHPEAVAASGVAEHADSEVPGRRAACRAFLALQPMTTNREGR